MVCVCVMEMEVQSVSLGILNRELLGIINVQCAGKAEEDDEPIKGPLEVSHR